MAKPLVFISCGQYSNQEKQLGTEICKIIEAAGFDPFFAETQSSLDGLNEKILGALKKCAGFIFVMHPRGSVSDDRKNTWQRGSVWIEQEVAIAAFLRNILGQQIAVAGYVHESIKREGIRDLLHLNPTLFKNSEEVLSDLPARVAAWKPRKDFEVYLTSSRGENFQGNQTFLLSLGVRTTKRASRYTVELSMPAAALSHKSGMITCEVADRRTSTHRVFRITEKEHRSDLFPGDNPRLTGIGYSFDHLYDPSSALDLPVTASAHTDNQSDEITTTLREIGNHLKLDRP